MRVAVGATVVLAVLAASGATRVAAAPAASSTTRTFSGWTATCDNLRNCVAIASSDDGDGLFYVRIARDAAADAAPAVKAVLAATDPIAGKPDAIDLVVGGPATTAFHLAARPDDTDGTSLAGLSRDPAVLAALLAAETADYAVGPLKGRLALKGLAAALRFVDDKQGRVGTPTALVARGMTPIGAVPPPPEPPVVRTSGIAITPATLPPLSRRLLDMAVPACDPETVEAHSEAAAWTLGPDRLLVAIPCAEGAYNLSVALYTTDAKGEQPRPAMLEQPPERGDAAVDNVVVNYGFDVKTATLSSLDKGRGLGDCGSQRSWVWSGEIFALLAAAELDACPGALPEDWPAVYTARREGAGR